MSAPDSLLTIRARPKLIEGAVRTALIEAIVWRLGGGVAPTQLTFGCAALAAVRLHSSRQQLGRAARLELATATERTARRFFTSPLGKRLMSVPLERIVAAPYSCSGPDVGIRDAAHRLHLISVTTLQHPLELGERAGILAARSKLAASDRLTPLRVHLYSLRTGQRHEYWRGPGVPSGLARTA